MKKRKTVGGRIVTLMNKDFVDKDTWLYLLLCFGLNKKERDRIEVLDITPLRYKVKGRTFDDQS